MREYTLENKLSRVDNANDEELAAKKRITLLNLEEFLSGANDFAHKKAVTYCLEHEKHSRVELFGSCILGSVFIPYAKGKEVSYIKFGYYIIDLRLFLIAPKDHIMPVLKKMQEMKFPDDFSIIDFFCSLLNLFLNEDIEFLDEIEAAISNIEERLLSKIPKDFYQLVIPIRRILMAYHSFFYQLVNISTVFRSNSNEMLSQEECIAFENLADRAERLEDYTETLREYLLQIREMYQSQLHVRETKSMNVLTIISSIFLPLTLIAGWYGMNFKYMPELSWEGGYIYVGALSIAIVIIEIIIFKKKKLL